jgi:hypothetical protein
METALEWVLTNAYKADMISWLSAHPDDFEEAIKLAISDKPPYSWRAAWLLWSCMEENDQRIQEYVKNIIDSLPDKNDQHQRELLIILQRMEIGEELEGLLFNHCVRVWEKTDKKPSVRFNAFKVMVKTAKKHPDLSREIMFLTQDQYMDSLSGTVKKSIAGMLRALSLTF